MRIYNNTNFINKNNFGIIFSNKPEEFAIQNQILRHIEGNLVGSTLVRLAMNGMFHKYFMESSFSADEFHKNPESFSKMLDFLAYLGWFLQKKGKYQFVVTYSNTLRPI